MTCMFLLLIFYKVKLGYVAAYLMFANFVVFFHPSFMPNTGGVGEGLNVD